MRFRYESPSHLVDLRNLGLSGIDEFGGRLRIGATTTDAALETSPTIRHDYPLIADVARVIADPLVRNLATIGGSAAYAHPSGDWGPALIAARALFTAVGPGGERSIPADQFFVEQADLIKYALLPATINNCVHQSFIVGSVRASAPHRPGTMEYGANGLFHECLSPGPHRPADIVGASFVQHGQALPHVVRRVCRMGIHANNNLAAGRPNGCVQSGGHNSARVAEHAQLRMALDNLVEIRARPVGGHSVGSDDFHAAFWRVLREDGLDTFFDVPRLIPARQHY